MPGGASGEVNGANAIVIRTIPGTGVRRGFAVTINSPREAEIYNNGIAGGWSSNRINSAIQANVAPRATTPASKSVKCATRPGRPLPAVSLTMPERDG